VQKINVNLIPGRKELIHSLERGILDIMMSDSIKKDKADF
jgi:hypothetical protein